MRGSPKKRHLKSTAIPWSGSNVDVIKKFLGGDSTSKWWTFDAVEWVFRIKTEDGVEVARPGDMIMKQCGPDETCHVFEVISVRDHDGTRSDSEEAP